MENAHRMATAKCGIPLILEKGLCGKHQFSEQLVSCSDLLFALDRTSTVS